MRKLLVQRPQTVNSCPRPTALNLGVTVHVIGVYSRVHPLQHVDVSFQQLRHYYATSDRFLQASAVFGSLRRTSVATINGFPWIRR